MIDRIGQGYDLHRLGPNRKLILGGVEIPFELGLIGHSDADVLIHAIIDALLGAAGLGDIGEHFPDTDPQYKDIASTILLEKALGVIGRPKYIPVNIDATIIAEKPKLSPYKPVIIKNLAKILKIGPDAVSIKAKTNETIGHTGRSEAIACHAIASLKRID